MRVRAFAKINLSLRVLGTRRDGFHELRTIFQSIALHDTLTIRASRGPFRLTCDDPTCPSDSTNLIWRAAERLWMAAGRRGALRDIAIDLKKRIPLQGGLGGGSSDAAAALRVLGRMWRVDEAQVHRAGAELGADIPYFFEGGTALGVERGDLIFPLRDHPPAWVVLVLPLFGVSTKEAFAWWDDSAGGSQGVGRSGGSVGSSGVVEWGDGGMRRAFRDRPPEFVNDLEPHVAAHHPQIRRAVAELKKAGAFHAAMSGSGSAVFGLFACRTAAAQAAGVIGSQSRRAVLTRTLDRARYQALAAK